MPFLPKPFIFDELFSIWRDQVPHKPRHPSLPRPWGIVCFNALLDLLVCGSVWLDDRFDKVNSTIKRPSTEEWEEVTHGTGGAANDGTVWVRTASWVDSGRGILTLSMEKVVEDTVLHGGVGPSLVFLDYWREEG